MPTTSVPTTTGVTQAPSTPPTLAPSFSPCRGEGMMPNAPPKVHVSARSDAHRSPDSPRAFQCPSHQGVRTSLTPAGERPSSSKATVLPPPHAARVRSARGASEADTARASGSQPPRPSTTTAGATRPPRVVSARSHPSVLSNVRKAADAPNPNPPATDGGPSSKVGGAAVARRRGNKYVPHSRFTRARMRIQVEWLDLITGQPYVSGPLRILKPYVTASPASAG